MKPLPLGYSKRDTISVHCNISCINPGVRELIVNKGFYPTVSDLTFYMMHTVHHNWPKKL